MAAPAPAPDAALAAASQLPWTVFPDDVPWSSLLNGDGAAPYRAQAIAEANAYVAEIQAPFDDAAEFAEMRSHPAGSIDRARIFMRRAERANLQRAGGSVAQVWTETYESIVSHDLHGTMHQDMNVYYAARDLDTNLTYLIEKEPNAWGNAQHNRLFRTLTQSAHLPTEKRDNLWRLAFNRLTLAQINGFGQWLRAILVPNGLDPLYARLIFLKLRAYVSDYVWRSQVERSDLARHIDSHHGAHARSVLDHIIAPMLDQPMQGVPVSVHPRPPSRRFPPPRTSQALRNELTGLTSEFGGINRGQPKRNASDDEEEEEEETEGPNASAAAAAPKPRKHPRKQQ